MNNLDEILSKEVTSKIAEHLCSAIFFNGYNFSY